MTTDIDTEQGAGATARALQERIEELESSLEAAQKTIDVLTNRVEAGLSGENVAVFEVAARLEQTYVRRNREVADKTAELELANQELRDLTDNLDKIVRQRTRALRESEEQLRRRNEELRRLNEMKREFISIAAHELRTPLTSMVGYLDLVHEGRFGQVPELLARPLGSVQRNAHRLRRLVHEMLDVSRIEANRMTLRRENVRLGEIVADVVDELRPLADTKNQAIEVHAALETEIHADADKIHQVVANLIANAIRYSGVGGRIDVRVDEAPLDLCPAESVRLRVADNGIGIAPGDIEKIFEPFSDIRPARHHTSSGPDPAGLGLYIARGLVDLHGGIISVESEEGEGTEFTVLLPRGKRSGHR